MIYRKQNIFISFKFLLRNTTKKFILKLKEKNKVKWQKKLIKHIRKLIKNKNEIILKIKRVKYNR